MAKFAPRAAAWAAGILASVVLCYCIITALSPSPVTHEPAAPAITQADGSVVLERHASVPAKSVKPRAQLPRGAAVERHIDLTVKPEQPGDTAKVEVNLVKMPDQSRRVVVYSDNAEVGGLDLPVELKLDPKHTWAAGVYADPFNPNVRGIFVDKDIGRIRIGAEVGQGRHRDAEVRLKLGVTF